MVSSRPARRIGSSNLRLSDFDFDLSPKLIAQEPAPERDLARLLYVDLTGELLAHYRVRQLPDLLSPGDLLIVNDSRVFPARISGKTRTGASVEMLLLERLEGESGRWKVLAKPAKRLRPGTDVVLGAGRLHGKVVRSAGAGRRIIDFSPGGEGELHAILEEIGRTPLPPYIHREEGERERDQKDRQRYQTVYAGERGSIAAPTAGLHFTGSLLEELAARGIGWARLTLHVGYGTFQPIRSEKIEEHRMEPERYTLPEGTVSGIEETRARGGRIVAVGTTVVRALESAAGERGDLRAGAGATELFIHPGFRFRVVDALVTNFHLPRSSLFLLVCAFGGTERLRRAYAEAIRASYRFYSYGDCMLLYPGPPGVVSRPAPGS